MSVLEHGGAGEQVGFLDDNGVQARVGLQRHRIASAWRAHGLRVDRRGTILTDDPARPFEKSHWTADLAGVEHRNHLAVRLLVQQETDVSSVFPRDEAVQISVRNLGQGNAYLPIAEVDRS